MPNNQSYDYDTALVVGRWQLPHLGHDSLFQHALQIAPQVIVVIGSAFRSRDSRQPFTAEEREDMIARSLAPAQQKRVIFLPVRDYYDDERWNAAVKRGVAAHTKPGDKIAVVGYHKDQTSYYLDQFPGWSKVQVTPQHNINATALRDMYFGGDDLSATFAVLRRYVKPEVCDYLLAWSKLPVYADLVRETAAIVAYRKRWTQTWYMTADALVRVNDHVLLVQRGGEIGRDLWAIPGGFVEPGEMFLPAALRELKEETGFAPLSTNIRAALKSAAVFEHPLRSPRGRIVTQAFYFAFGAGALPEVKANDDAKAVRWVPIAELPNYEQQLFEDHAAILDHFIGLFPA